MSFTIESIREYERLFQALGPSRSKTLPIVQLLPLMRLCSLSPTNDQLFRCVNMIDKETFTFGDFLDVLSRHMETSDEQDMNKILYQFFAHHDPHVDSPKEGYMSLKELRELLSHYGPDSVSTTSLDSFLEKNGIPSHSKHISISQFMQLFGKDHTHSNYY